jgi:hypothetical protein
MRLVELKRLSPYLSRHMKNVQIRGRTRPVPQFQVRLQFPIGLDLRLGVRIFLALQHPLDAPHLLCDPLLHLAGAKEEKGAQGLRCASGCDVEEEVV